MSNLYFQAREALNRVEELETENSHLTKRLDKLKNAKSALLKDLWQYCAYNAALKRQWQYQCLENAAMYDEALGKVVLSRYGIC